MSYLRRAYANPPALSNFVDTNTDKDTNINTDIDIDTDTDTDKDSTGPKPKAALEERDTNQHEQRDEIHFLVSCHSTPYYSHFHLPQLSTTTATATAIPRVVLRFLDCSPHFDTRGILVGNGKNLNSEGQMFAKDPLLFAQALYSNGNGSDNISDNVNDGRYNISTAILSHSPSLATWAVRPAYIILFDDTPQLYAWLIETQGFQEVVKVRISLLFLLRCTICTLPATIQIIPRVEKHTVG